MRGRDRHLFRPVSLIPLALISWAVCIAAQNAPEPQDIAPEFAGFFSRTDLRGFADSFNVPAMRAFAWQLFAGFTETIPEDGKPRFATWYPKDQAFQPSPKQGAFTVELSRKLVLYNRSLNASSVPGSQGVPLASVYFNPAMTSYLDTSFSWPAKTLNPNKPHLNYKPRCGAQVSALMTLFNSDPSVMNDISQPHQTIHDFPGAVDGEPVARAVKVHWVLVRKGEKPTAIPVWDPETNPALPAGNRPETWRRFVAVGIGPGAPAEGSYVSANFGAKAVHARVVPISRFFALPPLTGEQAQQVRDLKQAGDASVINTDSALTNAAAGDVLVAVAMHAASKDLKDWLWMTFWWHDQPDRGPYAENRPSEVQGPWRNYLMNIAFDMDQPREPDGSPRVCFNPYLEAIMAGGVQSNCMTCHRNAVIPAGSSGVVTRGRIDETHPLLSGRLRLDYVWSLANNKLSVGCQ